MSNYGFEIEIDKRKEQDSFYIGYLNTFILNSIGEYIDRSFQILNSEKIFETEEKNIFFSLNVKKTENKLYGEIRSGTVKELKPIYISRMEDIKFNNPDDKATFRERLEILFTGKVKGGRTKLIEVKK